MSLRFHRWLMIASALLAGSRGGAADYLRDVKPLLEHKCYACHGALKQQAGFRLDTGRALVQGGDSGSPVTRGTPDQSLLIDVLTGAAGFQMPPANEGAPLTEEEVDLIRQWIASGASVPEDELPQSDPLSWWSYQPIRRPALPTPHDPNWCRNEVDFFIAAERDARKLPVVEEAPRLMWLRRVYLDLIGLPPTRDEQHKFLSDAAPDASDKVVDDLLSRPEYGQRWGRHWMDVWRYSDWYGSRGINEIRYSQRHIWRWRDWIVASLNRDRGYDQLIREMLAGDELGDGDPSTLAATGFLGRNWYKFDRDAWLFETVERTGEAFLGLTLRCCRCHDHKFDPVSQEEYFRFRAIFEPHDVRIDPISASTSLQKDATLGEVLSDGIALVYDKSPDAVSYRYERGDSRYPDKSHPLEPGTPAALGGLLQVESIKLPLWTWYPMLRPELRETQIEKADLRVALADQSLRDAETRAEQASSQELAEAEQAVAIAQAEFELATAEKSSVEKRLAAEMARYVCATSDGEQLAGAARVAELQVAVLRARVDVVKARVAGDSEATPLSEAEARLETAVRAAEQSTGDYAPIGEQFPQSSTGRRAALAEWLVDSQNPRTARVAANHLWGRHFGQPLVATPENFGLNGRQPTHPELLDWLASELVTQHWEMKPIHRLLVLSATYRMASSSGPTAVAQTRVSHAAESDPNNAYYWRMNAKRMEAEVVRDSTFYLACNLDLEFGGPEIPEDQGEAVARRSLYFRNTPNEKMPMLEVFDIADPNACYRRKESIVPHQSLALMNSGLALDTARRVAGQLSREPNFVSAAFECVLSRPPTEDEVARCQAFLAEQAALLAEEPGETFSAGGTASLAPATEPVERARENLIHVLLLHNDFITIR